MKKMMIWRNLKKRDIDISDPAHEVSLHWLLTPFKSQACRSCNRYTVWNTIKRTAQSASLKTVQEIRLFFFVMAGRSSAPSPSLKWMSWAWKREQETRQRLTDCSSLIEKDRNFAVLSSSHFFMPSFFSMLLTIACKVIKKRICIMCHICHAANIGCIKLGSTKIHTLKKKNSTQLHDHFDRWYFGRKTTPNFGFAFSFGQES